MPARSTGERGDDEENRAGAGGEAGDTSKRRQSWQTKYAKKKQRFLLTGDQEDAQGDDGHVAEVQQVRHEHVALQAGEVHDAVQEHVQGRGACREGGRKDGAVEEVRKVDGGSQLRGASAVDT